MGATFEPELLLQHAAHVRALARRVVFDAELADEVEQETWLAALAHAPRELRDPRAWLARVVRHAARRLHARNARRNEHEERAGGARAAETSSSDPSDLVEREQALRALLAAVGRLPEPVRRAVVLHHLDGLTLSEVARRTETPLETVRSRVKRGLELLRADLARQRGSAAWSVFLVRAFELTPPAAKGAGYGLALVAREIAASFMLMSSTIKLGIGAAALLVLVGFLLVERVPRGEPQTARPAPSAEHVEPPVVATRAEAEPAPDERRAVPDATPAEKAVNMTAPSTGSFSLIVRWADDHSPAIEVPVRLDTLSSGERTWVVTGNDGRIERRGVAPGQIVAQTIFGGLAILTVIADGGVGTVLEIPVGIAVRGRVETSDGAAIADAQLFLSPGASEPQYEGHVVARTDVRGEFTLRTAPAGVGACLSARATGFAPSEQVILTGPPRSDVELTFVLAEPGRSVAGIVLGPTSEPIAEAEVLVGSEREWQPRRRADGTPTWAAAGELARTDAAGHFALAGVALVAVPIQVRAHGYPVWHGELAADAPQPLTIRLERAASVTGIVRTANGEPLAGVHVRTEPPHHFASVSTESAADGTYTLSPLPSGLVTLVAERPSRGIQVGGAAHATTNLELVAGAERRWDPELPADREVRGRVEAARLPLDGWTVRGWRDASADSAGYVEEARTDNEGRFVLSRPPDAEVGLALFARGGSPFPVARLEHVVPGGPEVVLRPDPTLLPTCTIRGRLVDARGEPVRSADVLAEHATFGPTLVHPSPSDGTFELGPLPAGEWTLQIDPLIAGWAVARQSRVLAPSERWDTGKITFGPGGTLVVRLTHATGAEPTPSGATAELVDLDSRTVAWLEFENDVARSRPVAPGTYRLVLTGLIASRAPAREITLVAGEETVIELEISGPPR